MERNDLANLIANKIQAELPQLKKNFQNAGEIRYFSIDNLLPESFCKALYDAFPQPEEMHLKKSLKEDKYVSAQMNKHDNILEETLFAFQDKKIIDLVHEITGFQGLEADPQLYAGGLSRMEKGQFLKPHLDNSHDKERNKYRVLNLLFYVSPNWSLANGGNLEVWPNGMKGKPIEIESKFNRLVVMETHEDSLHGVNQVKSSNPRCCMSNYYFSEQPIHGKSYYHVTKFYGIENQVEKTILMFDRNVRNFVRKSLPKNAFKNKHYYRKDEEN